MTSETAVDTGMKIRCSKDELSARLGVVSRGLSARPSVQIFGGMLLQASGDSLELSATDMELSVKARLEVEVLGEGSAAVPGRLLTDIVRLLPSSDVELEYQPEENTLRVTGALRTTAYARIRSRTSRGFRKLRARNCRRSRPSLSSRRSNASAERLAVTSRDLCSRASSRGFPAAAS